MKQLLFSHRLKIQGQFEDWCIENSVLNCAMSFLAWAGPKGWLNTATIVKELERPESIYVSKELMHNLFREYVFPREGIDGIEGMYIEEIQRMDGGDFRVILMRTEKKNNE